MTRLNEFVVANAYGFPQEGTLVDGHLVSASGVDIDSGRWFVLFDGTASKDTVKKARSRPSVAPSISAQAEACMSWLRARR